MPPGERGARRTTVAGHDFLLTPTQHRLLAALRSQPGRAFTRAELVALARPGTVVLERTVDVHIRALRRKLGSLAKVVRTVRQVGYCFLAPEE
jgi:two-component system phosphate regulon response regulator PhoB